MKIRKEQLQNAIAAASTDPTRFNINGIRIEDCRIVSTDGHRMHITDGEKTETGEPFTVALADCKRVLAAMGKSDSVEFERCSDSAAIARTSGGAEIRCELLVAEFPNYRMVVPDGSADSTEIWVSAKYLREACDAVIRAEGYSGKDSIYPMRLMIPANGLTGVTYRGMTAGEFMGVLMPQRGPK